jgi:hypothetical protein
MLLALGLSMLLYGLSTGDQKPEEDFPAPPRHIALGVSFTERERLDEETKQKRIRRKVEQQRKAAEQPPPRSITLLAWLKKQIMEVTDVR